MAAAAAAPQGIGTRDDGGEAVELAIRKTVDRLKRRAERSASVEEGFKAFHAGGKHLPQADLKRFQLGMAGAIRDGAFGPATGYARAVLSRYMEAAGFKGGLDGPGLRAAKGAAAAVQAQEPPSTQPAPAATVPAAQPASPPRDNKTGRGDPPSRSRQLTQGTQALASELMRELRVRAYRRQPAAGSAELYTQWVLERVPLQERTAFHYHFAKQLQAGAAEGQTQEVAAAMDDALIEWGRDLERAAATKAE